MMRKNQYSEEPVDPIDLTNDEPPAERFPLKEAVEEDVGNTEFEINDGEIDLFALKEVSSDESPENDTFDIMNGEYDLFTVVKAADSSETDENALDVLELIGGPDIPVVAGEGKCLEIERPSPVPIPIFLVVKPTLKILF